MGQVSFHNAVGVNKPFSRQGLILCCVLFVAAGCSMTGKPSPEELALIDNPPAEVRKKQDALTPLTLQWFREIEAKFLKKGRTLTQHEIEIARKIGVANPERVRVVILKDFPFPKDKNLLRHTKQYGLGGSAESGRTMGNIIMLKARFKNERWMLANQLYYIAHQEKMGRREFVRRFIAEHELMGNKRAPMVVDANRIALDFK